MKTRIIYFTLILLSMMLLTTCGDLFNGPKTISQRINAFTDTLNQSDRSDIQEHFHPSMSNYSQIASDTVFDSGPLGYDNSPFQIIQTSSADNSNGGTNVTCDFKNVNGDYSDALILWMLQDGDDWKIRRLELDIGASQPYILQNMF